MADSFIGCKRIQSSTIHGLSFGGAIYRNFFWFARISFSGQWLNHHINKLWIGGNRPVENVCAEGEARIWKSYSIAYRINTLTVDSKKIAPCDTVRNYAHPNVWIGGRYCLKSNPNRFPYAKWVCGCYYSKNCWIQLIKTKWNSCTSWRNAANSEWEQEPTNYRPSVVRVSLQRMSLINMD